MHRLLALGMVLASASLCFAAKEQKPATIRDLIQQLSSNDSTVRQQAAQQLGNLGAAGRPAVPALIQLVTDDKAPTLRIRAARALAQIGGAAVTPLAGLLKHEEEFVRRQAAGALARIGPDARAALPALVAALQDSSLSVRGLAADALGEIDAEVPATGRALIAVLAENGPTRRHARAALVRLGRPAVPVLADAVKANEADVRYQCIRVLGLLGPEAASAVPQLIAALEDKEPRVRRMAIVALGAIGPDAAASADPLAARIAGADPGLRSLAGAALAQIGRPAVKPLIELLKKDNQTVRIHALYVLRQLEADAGEAVPSLMDLLQDRQPLLRRMSALTLGRIGPAADRAVDSLIDLAADHDRKVRLSAALAVAQLRRDDPRALERLKKELERFSKARVSPALFAALDPARKKQSEQFLDNFVLAASPDFGIGISSEAKFAVNQLGPDAIPALVRTLNRLAANPGKNVVVPVAKLTPKGRRTVGCCTFWFV